MTLDFKICQLSIRPRASLILLNIYYFRLNIFKRVIFKGVFEKRAHCQKLLGGGGRRPLCPPPSSLLPAPEGLASLKSFSSSINLRLFITVAIFFYLFTFYFFILYVFSLLKTDVYFRLSYMMGV